METTPFYVATEAPLSSLSLPAWNTGLLVLAIPSTVLGISGNILVLASYLKFPELQSPTNLLIANQGLADLLTCALYGLYAYLNYTVSGITLTSEHKYTCLLALSSIVVSAWSSLFNLLFLSIDRLVNIQFPFLYARIVDERFVKKTIVALWLFMLAWLSAPLLGVNTWEHDMKCVAANVIPSWYFMNLFLVSSFVVLILVAGINLFICGIVIRKRKVTPSGNEVEQNQQKSQYKLTKMLLTVVGIFYACWLPYTVNSVILVTCPIACFPNGIPRWLLVLMEYFKAPVLYNSAINPLIYVWKSKAFKRSFQKILHIPVSANTDWAE